MNKRSTLILSSLLFALTTGLTSVYAQTTGLEVMEKVYNRPAGPTMTANLVMTITNSRGSTRERSIIQYSLDMGDTEKKIMFFTEPADVRDTSFMTWSYDDGRSDDQWIYLPALKRVKRISSDSKNDSFMGSDFTYDDLGERHPSEDRHTILREENFEGSPCYVIESIPLENNNAYSKTISWIVKDKWIGLKREFYNSSGKVYKTLTIDSFEEIDSYWVITDMTMRDLDRQSSSRIKMNDVSFTISLEDSFFSERQMKMGPRR